MLDPFAVDMVSIISVHSCSSPHSTSISSPREEMDFNHLMTWLFYYIAYFENHVSNVLRHSQLNRHHLDCLWSWTSLHSFFFVAGISKLGSILYLHVKEESLRETRLLVTDHGVYAAVTARGSAAFCVHGDSPRAACVWKKGEIRFVAFRRIIATSLSSLFGRGPEHHPWESIFTGANTRSEMVE